MEAQLGSESLNLCIGGTSTSGTDKRSHDWNSYDYRWDSNLFLARPVSESEKRRRILGLNEEAEAQDEGAINLEHPICQVDGCDADLSNEKDYHRRHKVCPEHSKAPIVSIRGDVRRFCQQCSKFHALEEFDEGKRSCRRRLDRHNGRRRKKNSENATGSAFSLNGNEANAIIITLLKIITNLESARPGPQNDQNTLINFLSSLATVTSPSPSFNISELLQRLQNPQNALGLDLNLTELPSSSNARDAVSDSLKNGGAVRDFDLNDAYFENENDFFGNNNNNNNNNNNKNKNNKEGLGEVPGGNNQSRTGKIVFKLFGKDPSDCPPNLRPEILTWLSHCPSEMESYIKPGCIVLTLYLCLPDSKWQELASNLAYQMERLIDVSNPDFWSTGWVYATLEDQAVFLHNGSIILEGPLLPKDPYRFNILHVTPVAVPSSSNVTFSMKGFNLSKSNARLFCLYNGEYLIQEHVRDLVEGSKTGMVQGGPECLTFSCSIPASTGRGFLEIEEYDHSSFSFPFIVTDEATCIEIRTLESHPLNSKSIHFLQELGWLLGSSVAHPPAVFSVARCKHLISFAINREWCNVLRKMLDIVFNGGVQLERCTGEEFVLGEDLLFEAVKRRSKQLVAFLLRYRVRDGDAKERYLFTPDMKSFGRRDIRGIATPLHLAAGLDSCESVLDALTDDPCKIGIKAWQNSRGTMSTNQTPREYAEQTGHNSYIRLIQTKLDSNSKFSYSNLINQTKSRHFDIEKGHSNCKICAKKPLRGYSANRFLKHRLGVMSLLCIAAVCVCVALILKTPPFVSYTKHPFLWDSLQSGST